MKTDKGFINGLLHLNRTQYSSEYIRKLEFINTAVPLNNPPYMDLTYEYSPDVFSFNFFGHSGKFFLDGTKTVRVISDRNYTVDFSNLKPLYNFKSAIDNVITSTHALNTQIFSQIKLTSDDGYQFYFGGSFNTLEVSFSYPSPGSMHPEKMSGRINAWYLTKVVTPDNNEIKFKYKEYSEEEKEVLRYLCDDEHIITAAYNKGADFFDVRLHGYEHRRIFQYPGESPVDVGGKGVSKSLLKTVYLTKIESNLQQGKLRPLLKLIIE